MRESILGFRKQGHVVETLIMGDEMGAVASKQVKASFLKRLAKSIIPGYVWRSLKDYSLLRFDRKAEQLLEKKIGEFRPDLVYERTGYLQSSGCRVCARRSVKYFIELNAPFMEEARQFEGGGSFFSSSYRGEEKQIAYAQNVFVISGVLKSYLLKRYPGTDSSKIIVVPNGVNLGKIRVDSALKTDIRRKYAIGGDTTVIGFVGSIFPYHGVDLLIRAFASVMKLNPGRSLRLMIVGDGYVLDELKHLAGELGIGEQVLFTNSVEHKLVFSYIDVMDITVLARSNWYCSPVKIFEYGALGKAIIAPDTLPVKEVMQDEIEGLLVPPDVENLTTAINRLVNDISLRVKLGGNFKARVTANYSWKNTMEHILRYARQ